MRLLGRALAALLVLAHGPWARACDACFGAEASPLIDGAKLGALALILVTAAVQVGFVLFFVHLWRRARRACALELETEWAELQKVPGARP